MIGYYAQRASEYERIYHRPERQSDLKELQAMIETVFRDHVTPKWATTCNNPIPLSVDRHV